MTGYKFTPGQDGKAAARRGAVRGLALAAEHVLGEANKTVPIEEFTLGRSGAVSTDPEALRAAVSYSTPYAARQHEEMGWQHDSGRRAKWLELTLAEEKDAVGRIISAAIEGEL